VRFKVESADPAYTANWGQLNKTATRTKCHRIVHERPDRARAIRAEIIDLRHFFEKASRPPTRYVPTPPPTRRPPVEAPRPIGLPPTLALDCGPPVTGNYDWYHVNFPARWNYWNPIVEWGMDYGDGKSFATHDETSGREDVFWHKYHSPGSYVARAWIIDSSGRRADASCTFTWIDGWSEPAPSPAYPDYGSGDLDCDDIGREVYVDGDDPNGLDRDNDGVGCEGW
jgi:hypothetical protein